MTEKNIFVYKRFLSLGISDFSLFSMLKLQPHPEKSHPSLSQQPPSKNWGPVKPHPFLKIELEVQASPPRHQKGGSTLCVLSDLI